MKKIAMVAAAALLAGLLAAPEGAHASSPPAWDVSGVWDGCSGLVGNCAYPFEMTLSQDGDGDVSGTIHYTTVNITGSITGQVDGSTFVFLRSDLSGYWANCDNCAIGGAGSSFAGTGSDSSGRQVMWQAEGQATGLVDVDIKPGSDPNCLNVNGHGVIPVAINGSASLDVTDVDVSSLSFAGLDVRIKGNGSPQCAIDDWNSDGYDDLVCQFVDEAEGWSPDNGTATLVGELNGGTPIAGSDSICLVPLES